MYRFKKVAIKIGSNVLTHSDGTLDLQRMSSLVEQVAALHRAGLEIILISSGSVAAGRSSLHLDKDLNPVSARQLFSAVGQAKLIKHYYELFQQQGIFCGQVLTTKESFGTRLHYLNQRNCIMEMLSHKVIPIVNENDTISVTELMFTDNDELSGLMATMMDFEALVILSNIDGIYNGNPSDPTSKVITEVTDSKSLEKYIQIGKSSFGRGGMLTKTNIARKVAAEGIDVFIANGKKDGILTSLLKNGSDTICTHFCANPKSTSSIKRWLAHSESFAKGEVTISEKASQALLGNKASSLLFIGITEVKGNFDKNDLVRICDIGGNLLAIGKAGCDSQTATQNIGVKKRSPFVHYDYMYLV